MIFQYGLRFLRIEAPIYMIYMGIISQTRDEEGLASIDWWYSSPNFPCFVAKPVNNWRHAYALHKSSGIKWLEGQPICGIYRGTLCLRAVCIPSPNPLASILDRREGPNPTATFSTVHAYMWWGDCLVHAAAVAYTQTLVAWWHTPKVCHFCSYQSTISCDMHCGQSPHLCSWNLPFRVIQHSWYALVTILAPLL